MEVFKIIEPLPTLASYIKHYWILQSNIQKVRRIIPVGSIELIFHRGDSMFSLFNNRLEPSGFMKGQKINYYDVSRTGIINMVIVIFQPHGMKSFFQLPIEEIFENRISSIDDLGIRALRELKDQVRNTENDEKCIEYIKRFFLKCLSDTKEYNFNRMNAVVAAINQQPAISIHSLSEIACLSYKQFKRIFKEYVGMNPQDFLRIVRFQRILSMLDNRSYTSFAQIAYDCGFFDQSHLIREFKIFTGYNLKKNISVTYPYSEYFS